MPMNNLQEAEIQELRRRLDEAEDTLRAIRSGEVDALVVSSEEGERVYTLQGADHPYRALIEAMQQGAASLTDDGSILYCNKCFAEMLQRPHEKVIGASVSQFLSASDRMSFEKILRRGRRKKAKASSIFWHRTARYCPFLSPWHRCL